MRYPPLNLSFNRYFHFWASNGIIDGPCITLWQRHFQDICWYGQYQASVLVTLPSADQRKGWAFKRNNHERTSQVGVSFSTELRWSSTYGPLRLPYEKPRRNEYFTMWAFVWFASEIPQSRPIATRRRIISHETQLLFRNGSYNPQSNPLETNLDTVGPKPDPCGN